MVLVVLVPGGLINLAAGFRPATSLGLAPLVSTAVVAVAAIAADAAGIAWGPLPIFAGTVLFALVAWVIRRVSTGWLGEPGVPRSPGTASDASSVLWPITAMACAVVLLSVDAIRILASPTNFSQTYDNIFHLNGVRWMVDNRNGSALDMRMISGDAPASFYPTAWHDIVSGGLLTMGSADAVAGTNALIIVSIAIIWPLSCLALVRRIVAPTAVGTVATGVLVASFSPLPYLLLRFGVLYPNHLGLCLLPAVMALAVSLLNLGEGPRWPLVPTLLTLATGMVALGVAHPNVALTMVAVLGLQLVTFWALTPIVSALRARRSLGRLWWRLGLLVVWAVGSFVAYSVVRPAQWASIWGPLRGYPDAVVEALAVSPLDATIVWVPAALTLAGVLAAIVRRRHWWLLASHLALSLLWVVAGAEGYGELRDFIVGPWYNDPFRLAAMLPITALPLAAVGLVWLVDLVRARVDKGAASRKRELLVTVGVTAALLASTQFVGGKPQMVDWARGAYLITAKSELVDSDEYAVIRQVPGIVPEDGVIAVNPWNGSSMVYAITGRHATATHVLYTPTEDTQILIDHLDDVATNPEVCPALIDLGVDWVLDFGQTRLINNEKWHYPGWDDLAVAPGFEVAARQGHATLYRLTACGAG